MTARSVTAVLATVCVFLLLGMAAGVLGLTFAIRASNNAQSAARAAQLAADVAQLDGRKIELLLLDGKTASAVNAKKTAREVELLIQQQAFDHAQTEQQLLAQRSIHKILNQTIARIERHVDLTLQTAVDRAVAHRGG